MLRVSKSRFGLGPLAFSDLEFDF